MFSSQMIEDDEAKFHLADQNKDGYLDLKEFCAFLHPYNYPYMHQYEIDRTLKLHDKNGDGFIDFKEYLGEGDSSVLGTHSRSIIETCLF